MLLKQKHQLDHNFRWNTCILLGCNNLFVLFESNNIYFCVNCKYFSNTVPCFSHPIWREREKYMLRKWINQNILTFTHSERIYERNMNLGFTTWLNAKTRLRRRIGSSYKNIYFGKLHRENRFSIKRSRCEPNNRMLKCCLRKGTGTKHQSVASSISDIRCIRID